MASLNSYYNVVHVELGLKKTTKHCFAGIVVLSRQAHRLYPTQVQLLCKPNITSGEKHIHA